MRLGAALAIAALAAFLAWPLRGASAYVDDHVYLLFARHLDSPLPLLFQDALGTFFFRPVGLLAWWLSGRLVEGAGAQSMIAMALHGANGLLLAALLRRWAVGAVPALAAGLVFVAHPAAFAAAAWLSDRFDLLAAAFGLATLIALEVHRSRPTLMRLAAAAGLLAAALLSKETAFAFVPCALAIVAWRGAPGQRVVAFAAIGLVAVAVVAVRPLVLRPAADPFLAPGLVAVLAGGLAKWSAFLPAWAVVDAGPAAGRVAWMGALAAAGLCLLAALRAPRSIPVAGLALGALLAAGAAAVQSPVVNASPLVPFAGRATFEAVAGSRFYYVPFLGFAAMLAALLHPVLAAPRTRAASLAGYAAIAATVVALAAGSRAVGREWVAATAAESPVREAALATVAAATSPPRGCKLYFLDTPPERGDFRTFLDPAIKARLPRGHPGMGCLLSSEHTPWYHVAATGRLSPQDVRPLEVIEFGGRPYPPLEVGNLTLHFLKAVDSRAIAADPAARFFTWRDGRFEEVTPAVRDGTQAVRFFDNR